jgi:hypothetical protein
MSVAPGAVPTGAPTTSKSHASLLLASALVALSAGRASAIHSGGVGACEACHSMHNSSEGSSAVAGRTVTQGSGAFLLKGGDPSSVCLHCHEAAGLPGPRVHIVSTSTTDLDPGKAPKQLTPGGDFGWLKKSYTWTPAPGGASLESPGHGHGHNIVASEYGYLADPVRSAAPGGTYPSANLSCTSCHDPHGKYRRLADGSIVASGLPILASGSVADSQDPVAGQWAVGAYRLLGGAMYLPPWLPGAFAFRNPPPDAVAPADYNRSESVTQTRVGYGRNMSEWCANCHPRMLENNRTTTTMKELNHPAGNDAKLPASFQTNYNAYVRTGVLTNVDPRASYLSLVPFEEGTADYGTLKSHARSDDLYLAGPDTASNVSCITCHRAHASGFDGILRFRPGNSFITVIDSLGAAVWPDPLVAPAEAQGRTAAETQQAYYGRPASKFSPFQATLCNKCHVKD